MRRLALLLALLVGVLPSLPVAAQAPVSREAVEQIVRDYLMREPEVLFEALQELRRRREAAEALQQSAMLAARADELFASPHDPILGNAEGDATLVEFFDYRCGYCRAMTAGMRELIAGDAGLRVAMKELPILGPDSLRAAKAALAAHRQGRYEAMHWALMEASDLSESGILALARGLGLDPARLAADMAGPEVRAVIDANLALAQALGINGTPSFVVGGTLLPGAVPVERLSALIAAERRGG
jgi:protein-disulfide isomerase